MRSVRNRITSMLREEESGSDTILQSLRNYLKDAKPRHYTEDENFVVRLRVPTRFFVYKRLFPNVFPYVFNFSDHRMCLTLQGVNKVAVVEETASEVRILRLHYQCID